ncbi:MAG: PAS domain S-box protein, partial [Deltaproteobacteria bacterium]|nr:PAS domain S-box protein [Deltaproteobacteria bacterium]
VRTAKDAPVGLVRLDEAALVLKANRYMADLLGIEDGSLSGASLFRFLTDASRTTLRYYLEELLVSGEGQLCELTFVKKDGSRVRTIIRSSLTKKKNGALIDAAVIDLTNSSGSTPALPDESLKNFADNVPDAIFRLDRNLRHVFVNSVMAELTGLTQDDLLELSLDDWDFLRSDAVALVKQSVEKALGTLAPQDIEIVNNDHAGSPAYFHLRLVPEIDREGEARTILGIMRDLTTQKRNEQVVQAEHSFREAVGRSLSIGIGAIDDHGRQIYVNPAFCRIVGWSREELLGMHFPYVYWPRGEIRKALRIFVAVRREKKPSGSFEVTLARRDGTHFDALIMFSAFYDNSGRRIGW